jgi:hypothetical protein
MSKHRLSVALVLLTSACTAVEGEEMPEIAQGALLVAPAAAGVSALDRSVLPTLLAAPMEAPGIEEHSSAVITLPLPDGRTARFRVWESPIFEPTLAQEFPDIRTYAGRRIDDPAATLRLDITPAGLRAQILSPAGTVLIDPAPGSRGGEVVSRSKRGGKPITCLTPDRVGADPAITEIGISAPHGSVRRTYRLAVAATGEYTDFHGGTKAAALAAITTTVNRVNGIYDRDLAIRLTLVGGETSIIYTNGATDPYTNGEPDTMLDENQTNLDAVIGSSKYDIGHVFGTDSGGKAAKGVCTAGSKGQGATGAGSPEGDGFDVDYVAHEIGHQFGASHTHSRCNGTPNLISTAYEPGSGSTIMAYAGICGDDDVQPNSDDYFHTASLGEIAAYTAPGAGGAACGTATATGNALPTISAGSDFTIPWGTAFALTASGSDGDGDALTFAFEEIDRGTTDQTRPLFRSRISGRSRSFPPEAGLLSGTFDPWERVALVPRKIKMRVTARDGRGGIADDSVTLTAAGDPFFVYRPTEGWPAGSIQTVRWGIGGGAVAPRVNILLSTNGGASWTTLAANTLNDGAQQVLVPTTLSSRCHLKVAAVGNVFYDVTAPAFAIGCATSTTPIASEQTLSGSLSTLDCKSPVRATSYHDKFTFTATAGARYVITMSSIAFDPWLVLHDPAGNVVAQDDNGGGGTSARIVYAAVAGGTHTIETTSKVGGATGTYTVKLSRGGELISNGGFELGSTGWGQSSKGLINNDPATPPHAGAYKATLLGDGRAHEDILFAIPNFTTGGGSYTLTFYLRITSQENTSLARDRLSVDITDALGNVLQTVAQFSNLDQPVYQNYRLVSVPITTGATLGNRLTFHGFENATAATTFFIDDVSIH